jgi:hypothetical protein
MTASSSKLQQLLRMAILKTKADGQLVADYRSVVILCNIRGNKQMTRYRATQTSVAHAVHRYTVRSNALT